MNTSSKIEINLKDLCKEADETNNFNKLDKLLSKYLEIKLIKYLSLLKLFNIKSLKEYIRPDFLKKIYSYKKCLGDILLISAEFKYVNIFEWIYSKNLENNLAIFNKLLIEVTNNNLNILNINFEIFNKLLQAARFDSLSIIEWAYLKGLIKIDNTNEILNKAAKCNSLKIIEWAYLKGLITIDNTNEILNEAAECNSLKIIEWAYSEDLIKKYNLNINKILNVAVLCNNLDIIKFVHSKKDLDKENLDSVLEIAARYNLLKIFEWDELSELVRKLEYNEKHILFRAASFGSLKIIKWANDKQLLNIQEILYIAALNGRYNIIEWAIINKYKFDDITYHCAEINDWYATRDMIEPSDFSEEKFSNLYENVLKKYNLGKNTDLNRIVTKYYVTVCMEKNFYYKPKIGEEPKKN